MRRLVSPLDGIRSPFGGRFGFSPAALFASGEQGVWYDPSDFSTLFQNSTGTTPVTAVEQPVGLVLDKSKGLVLGAELVSNGTFDANITGWTDASSAGGAIAWNSGGWMDLTYTTAIATARQSITTQAGKTYRVSIRNVSSTTSSAQFFIGSTVGNADLLALQFVTNGTTLTAVFTATGTSSHISIRNNNAGTASVDNVTVRELPGNHASQSTPSDRPVLKQDANGKYYLFFDGTDDSMATGTINPGSVDKAQVFAGVRKLSDAAQGVLAEWSATIASNNGTFLLAAPDGATATFGFDSKGTVQVDAVASSLTAPLTRVVTGLGDISGDTATIRINGVQADQDTGDQGTGNYLSYPLYIGSRAGTSLRFNGHLYSLVVRFSATNLPDATIAQTETWVNGKTGAY